jgi:hypothetical protein
MAKSLEELAREAVRLQLEHRSPPKARALLKALSKNTSDKPKQQVSQKGAENMLSRGNMFLQKKAPGFRDHSVLASASSPGQSGGSKV